MNLANQQRMGFSSSRNYYSHFSRVLRFRALTSRTLGPVKASDGAKPRADAGTDALTIAYPIAAPSTKEPSMGQPDNTSVVASPQRWGAAVSFKTPADCSQQRDAGQNSGSGSTPGAEVVVPTKCPDTSGTIKAYTGVD